MSYRLSGRQTNQTRHHEGKDKIEESPGENSPLEEIFQGPEHDKRKRRTQLTIVPQVRN